MRWKKISPRELGIVHQCFWIPSYSCITDIVFCHPLSSVRLSSAKSYHIPLDGPQSSYTHFISMLPSTEHPDVFGQHCNADIASQIADTRTLFDTLLSLQPQVTSATAAGARSTGEDKVREKRREEMTSLVEIHNLIDGYKMRPTIEWPFKKVKAFPIELPHPGAILTCFKWPVDVLHSDLDISTEVEVLKVIFGAPSPSTNYIFTINETGYCIIKYFLVDL